MDTFKKILSDNNLDPETLSLSHTIPHYYFCASDEKGDCVSGYPVEYHVFIKVGAVTYHIWVKLYDNLHMGVWVLRYEEVSNYSPLVFRGKSLIAANLNISSHNRLFSIVQDHFPYPLYIF